MKEFKEKFPLIITGITYATYLVPFVILLPILFLSTIFGNELGLNVIGNVFTIIFLVIMVADAIAMLFAPLIQFVLIIIAIINRKWGLMGVHIVSVIIFCGVIKLFFELFVNRP